MPIDAEPADHELMQRIAQQDRAALSILVRRHQARIRALATRFLGDAELADDICQDTFLRVLRSARSYRPDARFSTWVYRIVANLCWDQRRKAARGPRQLAGEPPTPGDGHVAPLEQREREAQVRAAVAALPDRQRLALLLHRYQGLSHAEIADATGWTAGAVESCLVRAYATLRDRLASLQDP